MKVESVIDDLRFQTSDSGRVQAALFLKKNEELEKLGISALSNIVDETNTEQRALAVKKGLEVEIEHDGKNVLSYQVLNPKRKITPLPTHCTTCKSELKKVNTLGGKIKSLTCLNRTGCIAQARSSIYRLFHAAGVADNLLIEQYLDNHYMMRIEYVDDLRRIYEMNKSDANTEPRQKMWNGNDALWNIEKTLLSFLTKPDVLTPEQFWKITFNKDLSLPYEELDLEATYPIEIILHISVVRQFKEFFKAFKNVS